MDERGAADSVVPEEYWTLDVLLGQVALQGEPIPLRAWVHQETAPLSDDGGRIYIDIAPYLTPFVPKHTSLPVATLPLMVTMPAGTLSRRGIGRAQGGYFPEERVIELWDCFLAVDYRRKGMLKAKGNSDADLLYEALWSGVVSLLMGLFPDAAEMNTPLWQPAGVSRRAWMAFLERHGYLRRGENTAFKPLPPRPETDDDILNHTDEKEES